MGQKTGPVGATAFTPSLTLLRNKKNAFRGFAHEHISERHCEQIADVPVPQVAEHSDGPVPRVLEKIVEVVRLDPLERPHKRMDEQVVDAPVPQSL